MDPGGDHALHVPAGEESTLAHHDGAGRDHRKQREGCFNPGLEGSEVSVIDPDHRNSERQRAIELLALMDLHQRSQADPLGRVEEIAESGWLQSGHDEKHRVGPSGPRFPELVLIEDEIFSQEREIDRCPSLFEEVEVTLEIVLIGQDRQGSRAVGGVGSGEAQWIEGVGQDTPGRGSLFHLGNQLHSSGPGRAESLLELPGGRKPPAARLKLRAGEPGLLQSQLFSFVG